MKKNTNTTGLKIAVLSWTGIVNSKPVKGSSLGKFQKATGLTVPIEFTRISNKDGRLVPIISENFGKPNNIFYAISKHKAINPVFDELVKLEKVGPSSIGVVDIRAKQTSEASTRHSNTTMAIANWARKNKIDVVLWLATSMSFKDRIGVKFSPTAAVDYVNKLDDKQKKNALSYLKKVSYLETPVMDLIKKQELI
jgi:hypothetical protein